VGSSGPETKITFNLIAEIISNSNRNSDRNKMQILEKKGDGKTRPFSSFLRTTYTPTAAAMPMMIVLITPEDARKELILSRL